MKPLGKQSLAPSSAVCCELAAEAVVRANLDSLEELRRHPGPVHGEPLPASLLKHADEQTIAGLCAVYQAIAKAGLQTTCFCDWGVVAAPRFLGRPAMAAALQRFLAEGAWGVSPHLIPHRSLHSLSGTISQALKIHGPNFGVGGGPDGTVEALLAATALLERKHLPGVWVVLTCLSPQLPPDEAGRMPPGTRVVGLALALRKKVRSEELGVRSEESKPNGSVLTPHSSLLTIRGGVPDAEILARIEHNLASPLRQQGMPLLLLRAGEIIAERST